MCNLNCLFVKKKQKEITPFLMAVSSHSYAENDDGEGIYFNSADEVVKSQMKIDYYKYASKIENSNVIITHQRLSSSGHELAYNHPFVNDDFVLIHNGVMNQFMESKGSDTFGFWNKFNTQFKGITSHIAREEKIVKVLSQMFEEDKGSYSILIWDKKMKVGYYFKNSPSISFYKNNNYLYITTNWNNKVFLSMIDDKKFIELDIKPRVIYKITINFEVFKVFTFKPEPQPEIEEKNFGRQNRLIFCKTCNKFTDNEDDYHFSSDAGGYVCPDCYSHINPTWDSLY